MAYLVAICCLALLCLLQAYFLWRPVWVLIFGVYAVAFVAYIGLLVLDLVAFLSGAPLRVLLNVVDSVVFVSFLGLMAAITWALLRSNPFVNRPSSV